VGLIVYFVYKGHMLIADLSEMYISFWNIHNNNNNNDVEVIWYRGRLHFGRPHDQKDLDLNVSGASPW